MSSDAMLQTRLVPAVPLRFAEYRNRHAGEDIVVCGCGRSLLDFTEPQRCATIGVNDVGRFFQPDYLVVINHRTQFPPDRFHHIETSQARALFTQLNLGIAHPAIVRFALGRRSGTEPEPPDRLPFTRNSPYVAVALALHMGARRIGLIGVDFTADHFFGATGTHSLARELNVIDAEYRRLYEAARARGVEIVNLSTSSRLTALPKMSLRDFAARLPLPAESAAQAHLPACPRLFFVNYRFLSAGDVFTEGLRHAARALELPAADADWNDPALTEKVRAFAPDLLFAVHGRRFAQRMGGIPAPRRAVWLLDEPYEVDDTASWSSRFDAVFVNDPATLARHANAHYLPAAYDPDRHHPGNEERPHAVGFVGGHNARREALLLRLLDENLLSYVVGGPWRSPRLQAICLALTIPATETAELYRRTRIVINVFRERHHFNSAGVAPFSANPRVYEALACGALVVSERRPELETAFPALPLFDTADELAANVRHLLGDPAAHAVALDTCRAALTGHRYADRLAHVLEVMAALPCSTASSNPPLPPVQSATAPEGWIVTGAATLRTTREALVVAVLGRLGGGDEAGLATATSHADVRLSFALDSTPGAIVIAKLHQQSQTDQRTNSYHLVIEGRRPFVAMHDRVLHRCPPLPPGRITVALSWVDGVLSGHVGPYALPPITAPELVSGYGFIGLRAGSATIAALSLGMPNLPEPASPVTGEIVLGLGAQTGATGFLSLDDGCTLTSAESLTDAVLDCRLTLDGDTTLLAKLCQQDRRDPLANSYHVLISPTANYLARHHLVLTRIDWPREGAHRLRFLRAGTRLQLFCDDQLLAHVQDVHLAGGFAALAVSQGRARLSGLTLAALDAAAITAASAIPMQPSQAEHPPRKSNRFLRPLAAFTAVPVRNLIYHVWPTTGSVWGWNLEQLLQRIDLFNGRRVIAIAEGDGTDDAAEVRRMLDGHHCEIVTVTNTPLGEVESFPRLLEAVWSDDPNEVSFYGHAKGVKYREAVSDPVRRWTEALYRTTLDDWPAVRAALDCHVMAGSFRRFGTSRAHRNVASWHYSGTFFWLRHGFLPNDAREHVPNFYGGVEAWPGIHVPVEHAACLFMDDVRQLPYLDRFWRGGGDQAIARWAARPHRRAPPADLAHPVPFEGFATPRLEQNPAEMAWLMEQLLKAQVRNVLTIGARHGGLEWHLARKARATGIDIALTTIELAPAPELLHSMEQIRSRWGQTIRLVTGDSGLEVTRAGLAEHYDAVFIDGDHGYRGARADWELAQSRRPRLVAFHDIVDTDFHASEHCCVSRLWRELRTAHDTRELALGDWGGIGVVEL